MTLSVQAFLHARGVLDKEEKLSLEVEPLVTAGDVRRLLAERLNAWWSISESLRIILAGVALEDDSQPLHVAEAQTLRAIFVERRNRPHVDEVEPFMGLTSGGAKVVVKGDNFPSTVRAVRFGTTLVEAMRYSSSLLTCTAPPHAPGIVGVEVESPGEGFTSDGRTYTYVSSVAEAAEITLAACSDNSALAPQAVEDTCRPINPLVQRRQ